MFHDPELVRSVVVAQKLTRLYAYEINSKDPIDRFDGNPADVCERVAYLVSVIPGPFRIEVGSDNDTTAKGGPPSKNRVPLVWNLMGVKAISKAETAATLIPAVVAGEPPKGYVSPSEFALAIQLEQTKLQLARATECSHGVKWTDRCRGCEAEEEEEEEQPVNGQQVDVDKTKEIVSLVRDIMRELKGGAIPAPAGVIAGPVDETMTEQDRETWRAIQRMKAAHPEGFADYQKQLLDGYGDKAATDGAAK